MWRTFFTVLTAVFLAEMGDKTQLATMLFASDRQVNRLVVFAAAAIALTLAAGIGVLVGAQIERFVAPRTLKLIAGVGFVAIGVWTIVSR
jgi:putative Ca2+/H+ antiporter (TMEM165/GDT1 family)